MIYKLMFAAVLVTACGGGGSSPTAPTTSPSTANLQLEGQPSFTGAWRGLVVAHEQRCTPYNPAAYQYPAAVEARINGLTRRCS